MEKKLYSSTEKDLLADWFNQWVKFTSFVNGLIWTDDPLGIPYPPTETDESEYQKFRFWFFEHEEQFLPIWRDYYKDKAIATPEDPSIEHIEESLQFDWWVRNPFRPFYKPESIYMFAHENELQSRTDIWKPNHSYAAATMTGIIALGQILNDVIG